MLWRRMIILLASLATLTGARVQPRQEVDGQTRASASACFNFSEVTGYRLNAGVRVELEDGRTFDLELSGAGCAELESRKKLSITNAPLGDLCAGPQSGDRLLKFSEPDAADLRCRIERVTSALR